MPKELLPPDMDDVEIEYWRAFCDLTSERQEGGTIPWSAIRSYWNIEGFGDFQSFRQIIGTLDDALTKHHENQRKKQRGE